jgi:hypothetical protein
LIWRFQNSAFIIPAELHQKITQSCQRVDQVPSEILNFRQIPTPILAKHKKKRFRASQALATDSAHKVAAAAGG